MKYLKAINVIYDSVGNLKRVRREMTVERLLHHCERSGAFVSERDMKKALRYLESRGCGKYIAGRHRHKCRFRWSGDWHYVRAILRKEISGSKLCDAAELSAPIPVIARLMLKLEEIVTKLNTAIAEAGSRSPINVEPIAAAEPPRVPTLTTPPLRIPSEGCFIARDVHALNSEQSLVWVRLKLKEMVEQHELDVVAIKTGRVGRPVNLYARPLAKAA